MYAIECAYASTSVKKINTSNTSLRAAAEKAYERELIDDANVLSREMFLKPFRDDVDSRHEYRYYHQSPVTATIHEFVLF